MCLVWWYITEYFPRSICYYFAALFHDISKNDTFAYKRWFWTCCPGHEQEWALKIIPILNRFDLSEVEKQLIILLIKFHWEIHYILDSDNVSIKRDILLYRRKHEKIYIELIVLALADTLASDLDTYDKDNFNFRLDFYKKEILNFKF